MHYVDRQSDSDADAPVLAPPDYLVSRVTVPPSTVGVHPAFRPHPDKGPLTLAQTCDSVSTLHHLYSAGRERCGGYCTMHGDIPRLVWEP